MRDVVKKDINISASDSIKDIEYGLLQYKTEELKFNQKFVSDLETLAKTAFDRQLEKFEDEELGFFAGYGYMFSYIFKSKQSWEDEMRLKSDKYFGSINIEQDAYELFTDYQNDIRNLRSRFWSKSRNEELPQATNLNLPQTNISLSALSSHSGNNIIIELLSEGLDKLGSWLLYPLILWLLTLFLPNNIGGCLAKVIVFIIAMAVSVLISMWNDDRLLDKLKEQNTEITTIDYEKILNSLNDNTLKFYESN